MWISGSLMKSTKSTESLKFVGTLIAMVAISKNGEIELLKNPLNPACLVLKPGRSTWLEELMNGLLIH